MQEERSIRIRVEDTGEGITPEFLPHIFDRFRQQDGSITRKHGGLGLGLAIVKNLVELHAGTASAESDGQGKGAAFTVVLPSCVNDGPGLRALLRSSGTAPTTAVAHSVVPSLEGVRVLVVDDAPHSRELLSQVLAESGASVQTVDSARHALRLLHEFNPNVLISDVGMPEMDGYSFIRRVREAGNSCGALPCLAVTALARPEDRARALASGFNDHLAKPVDPAMLTRVVAFLSGRASAPAR